MYAFLTIRFYVMTCWSCLGPRFFGHCCDLDQNQSKRCPKVKDIHKRCPMPSWKTRFAVDANWNMSPDGEKWRWLSWTLFRRVFSENLLVQQSGKSQILSGRRTGKKKWKIRVYLQVWLFWFFCGAANQKEILMGQNQINMNLQIHSSHHLWRNQGFHVLCGRLSRDDKRPEILLVLCSVVLLLIRCTTTSIEEYDALRRVIASPK